ncbi:MAG TPA: cupin domain-containing protein [Steroidobacteraceae bacterium]|nr:cupin domain-containing protein [Steroidobacteraceae bacterium]
MLDARTVAQRLTGSLSIADFNREVRERRFVCFRAAFAANEAAGVYGHARLDAALAAAVIPPHFIDIFSGGQLVKLADVQNKSGLSASALIVAHLRQGATIRVRELQMFDAGIAALTGEVQQLFAARSQINLYLTPPWAEGFPPHFDTTDVFIIQCSGAKAWTLFERYADRKTLPLMETPWEPARYVPQDAGEMMVLTSGDALYLPRGTMHAAACLAQASLHLTVGLTPLTVADVMAGEVKRFAEGNVQLRQRAIWAEGGDTSALTAEIRRHFRAIADTADAQVAVAEERQVLRGEGETRSAAGALVACLTELESAAAPSAPAAHSLPMK